MILTSISLFMNSAQSTKYVYNNIYTYILHMFVEKIILLRQHNYYRLLNFQTLPGPYNLPWVLNPSVLAQSIFKWHMLSINTICLLGEQWWLSLGSSGGSLVATPDCAIAVLGSNPAISPAYSGLPVLRWAAIWVLRWAAIWDGTSL
jgi:hypothetical protein